MPPAGVVAGAFTWYTVSDQLAAEKITVSDDASCQAGQSVNGPLEAYCQAEIINHHALEATGGKTYAELDREDPLRATAQSALPRVKTSMASKSVRRPPSRPATVAPSGANRA